MAISKIQLLINPAPGLDKDVFRDAVLTAVADLGGGDFRLRAGFALEQNPIASLPHGQGGGTEPERSFYALVELFSDNPDFRRTAAEPLSVLAFRLKAAVDPALSAVIAGTEYPVLPGWGDLQLVFAIRRLPHLSREAYQDYWLNHHVHFATDQGRNDPTFFYRQFHTLGDWTDEAGDILGYGIRDFDGVAEVYYQTVEEIVERFSKPEVAGDAFADEQTFIDHGRSWLGFFRIVVDRG